MKEYNEYSVIAGVYEKLNGSVDYRTWADYVEACLDRYLPKKPPIILDLACGTGKMTRELSGRGYDMIGVDASPEMLTEAQAKEKGDGKILYLCQKMQELDLFGTVGAVTCCLDSLNYLTEKEDLLKTFEKVHLYCDPGALFLFDMNTPYKFESVYGNQTFVLRDREKSFLTWENCYSKRKKICQFLLTLFTDDGNGRYRRSEEYQEERCYSLSEIRTALNCAGFELLSVSKDFSFSPPDSKTERWYFVAKAIKQR